MSIIVCVQKVLDICGLVWKLLILFGFQIFVVFVFGVVVGLIGCQFGVIVENLNGLFVILDMIGSLYVMLLCVVVVLLIFMVIVVSIFNFCCVQNVVCFVGQMILWFVIIVFIVVIIGIGFGFVIQLGNYVGEGFEIGDLYIVGMWWNFFFGFILQNFFGFMVSINLGVVEGMFSFSVGFNIFQVIVVVVVVGIVVFKVGKKVEFFFVFIELLFKVIQCVLWWIICIVFFGMFGLIGLVVIKYGWEKFVFFGWFVGVVYIGFVFVLFVVYLILVCMYGLLIKQYFFGVWLVVQLVFVSCFLIGMLFFIECVIEWNLGVFCFYVFFVVLFGVIMKMDGCVVIYLVIVVIFVVQFFGIELNFVQYLLIVIVLVVGFVVIVGIIGVVVMFMLMLFILGLLFEGVGLLFVIDLIFDMGCIVVNVVGQVLILIIVVKCEGILNEEFYNVLCEGLFFVDDLGEEEVLEMDVFVDKELVGVC